MRMRYAFVALALLCTPSLAVAGAKEDALAAFNNFLTLFTSADADKVAALFTPDALFYGTESVDLVTTPEGVKAYFVSAFTPRRAPGAVAAKLVSAEAMPISDEAVVVSGRWLLERLDDGMPVPDPPLRVSMLVVKRGDRWMIAQFHTSATPTPSAAVPAPAR
jgi:uncharacterized protein (TIGR02246 family)